MVDEPNYNPNSDNRPKLKKVKRPINKMAAPGQGQVPPKAGIPQQPNMQNQQRPQGQQAQYNQNNRPENPQQQTNRQPFNAPIKASDADSFNLDSYLDEEEVAVAGQGQFITEEDLNRGSTKSKFIVGNLFTLNFVIAVSVAVFLFGVIMTKLLSSGEKVVQDGLQGVVVNPEVPRGRARCGVAERTQGCVLYVMNPQRQELNARDFYDLAAQLTGRQKFVIETGNIRYSNTRIKPGAIAQFNIPPLIN